MLSTCLTRVAVLTIVLFVAGVVAFLSPFGLFFHALFSDFARMGEPFGFIDRNGRVVNDLRSFNQSWHNNSDFSCFSEGVCTISFPSFEEVGFRRDKYAYLRPDGSFVANGASFYGASRFSEGLAAVDVKKRDFLDRERDWLHHFDDDWCFIDKNGTRKFGSYSLVQNFSQGLAAVRLKDTLPWQFVDKNGIVKIEGPYSEVTSFTQNRAAVLIGDKWGLIDKSGKEILKPVYDRRIRPFHEGLAAVEIPKSNRVDYLNADGEVQISLDRTYPPRMKFGSYERGKSDYYEKNYRDCNYGQAADANVDVSEGLVVIEKDGKFGYANVAGRTIIAPRFDYCWPFVEGRARVFQKSYGKGLFGFIDHAGKEVISCKYVEVSDFSEGFAVVVAHDGDHSEYIDYSGRNVFGKTFPQAGSFHEGRAFVGRPARFF